MVAARRTSPKVTDKIPSDAPFYTFEIFPPKTDIGTSNLVERIGRMRSLNPAWIHVTWGAGGSTQERSLELAGAAQDLGLDVCLHLTCTNMEQSVLDTTLQRAKEMGVRNLLALRGDPPRGEEYWVASSEDFQHATDLVRYIRKAHGDYFCLGVAGYPEGHADSADRTADVRHLKDKQDAGADFIVTQLFYDVPVFLDWYEQTKRAGITIPILPGIMPIQNYQSFRRMTNLCKSHIPPDVLSSLEQLQHDDSKVKEYGVDLSVKIMRQLHDAGIRGFHLCTLNLEKSVTQVLERLQWTHAPQKAKEATTWDEFPNGRFGDARSPAYGELDGYGAGLKTPASEALRQWGSPVSLEDVTRVFSSYLRGVIPTNPWSEEPLRAETGVISAHLLKLNDERHWWTVGSQPAVDGAPSSDAVHGFGPKGGYVYQKAFVEFFISSAEVDAFERAVRTRQEQQTEGAVMYFAGNAKGEYRTNMDKNEVNAVTWGVFKGREIVTTTLIEEMSFKAWREEAFEIWRSWALLYPPRSASREYVRSLSEDRWLVSVVHHDYKDRDALWTWLSSLRLQ